MTGEITPRPERDPSVLRASHQDRDRVVEILRDAAGDGRLTPEELDQRLEAALTARTYAELAVLTTDLPAAGSAAIGVPAGDAQPKELMRRASRSGSLRRDGSWVVPRRIESRTTSGSVLLDFTRAVVTVPVLDLNVDMRSGSLSLITMPGIVVDADDVSTHSGSVRIRAPWGNDVPVRLRINLSGTIRSGSIVAGPRRRTFWQWLRRAPRSWEVSAR